MRFERVLLIGAGKVAVDCTRFLCGDMAIKCVEVIESSDNQFSMLGRVCKKFEISYRRLLLNSDITEALLEAAKRYKILIISANNRYLFRKDLCLKENVEIINFHYGYLPQYRGMNIPTWVIYNTEPYTGVTWHYVTDEVDRGEIIEQEKIMLHSDSTAYEVVRDGMRIGVKLFTGFISKLLEERIQGKKILTDEHIYLNKQLPQNGIININAPIMDIYKLLRSFDYGRTGTLRPLEICINNEWYTVEGYEMTETKEISVKIQHVAGQLLISESGKQLRMEIRKKGDAENKDGRVDDLPL